MRKNYLLDANRYQKGILPLSNQLSFYCSFMIIINIRNSQNNRKNSIYGDKKQTQSQ